MADGPSYEVAVVGGGPAGMTTALYTTRLGHRTAVFEKAGGRHAAVEHVHNLYGISEDVSGTQLAAAAVGQLEAYGGDYYLDAVDRVEGEAGEFRLAAAHATVEAERVVLATGFTDRDPAVPGLQEFAGRGLHYCLHCDAFTLGDSRTFVLGHDDNAASAAMLLLNFTPDVDLLLDNTDPEWSPATGEQLAAHPVDRIEGEVVGAVPDDERAERPRLGGLAFADGRERQYRGGFAMYGKDYNTEISESLGCDHTSDGAIDVDERGATSVAGVYAVGDVTHGQNQTAIAIADGARAGIALHKGLRTFPRDPSTDADVEAPAAPPDLRARMRLSRERDRHPGLRTSRPEQ